MSQNKFTVVIVIVIVALLVLIVSVAKTSDKIADGGRSEEMDNFNQCLVDSGAKYYGAAWCPNCANQSKLLGYTKPSTPPTYIECSLVRGNPLAPVCQEVGIRAFPTWDFTDGTRLEGTQSLETLATQTSCPLPGSNSAPIDEGAVSDVDLE